MCSNISVIVGMAPPLICDAYDRASDARFAPLNSRPCSTFGGANVYTRLCRPCSWLKNAGRSCSSGCKIATRRSVGNRHAHHARCSTRRTSVSNRCSIFSILSPAGKLSASSGVTTVVQYTRCAESS